MKDLKNCPYCEAEVHADDVRRAEAHGGIIRYPCGTRKAIRDTVENNVPRGQMGISMHEGDYQSKDCLIKSLKSVVDAARGFVNYYKDTIKDDKAALLELDELGQALFDHDASKKNWLAAQEGRET